MLPNQEKTKFRSQSHKEVKVKLKKGQSQAENLRHPGE